jgi:hypothetical protein
MRKKTPFSSVAEKIAAGAVLDFRREFCPWAGISPVMGYDLINSGKVKTAKIGRKRVITTPNALAFRDSLSSGEAA